MVQFYVEGQKVQGIGYRAHLAMLALISGVERLYAENLPPENDLQKVVVYAGARSKRKVNRFYESVKEKIPAGAIGVRVTKPAPYHSKIEVPPVLSYVNTLTAGELEKGISSISALRDAAVAGFDNLSKDINTGFDALPSRLAESLTKELVPKFGEGVVDALVRAGIVKKDQ